MIELTRLVERKEGRGLGELGKGQAHLRFSLNTDLAYYKGLFVSMCENQFKHDSHINTHIHT
jgi:hypothetical protein